jgi:hypothetical protein
MNSFENRRLAGFIVPDEDVEGRVAVKMEVFQAAVIPC